MVQPVLLTFGVVCLPLRCLGPVVSVELQTHALEQIGAGRIADALLGLGLRVLGGLEIAQEFVHQVRDLLLLLVPCLLQGSLLVQQAYLVLQFLAFLVVLHDLVPDEVYLLLRCADAPHYCPLLLLGIDQPVAKGVALLLQHCQLGGQVRRVHGVPQLTIFTIQDIVVFQNAFAAEESGFGAAQSQSQLLLDSFDQVNMEGPGTGILVATQHYNLQGRAQIYSEQLYPCCQLFVDHPTSAPMYRLACYAGFSKSKPNPFEKIAKTLTLGDKKVTYYSLPDLNDPRLDKLPYSIRILLESAIRNCDEFEVNSGDVENILDWEKKASKQIEIPFKPARVILQDFTGVPAVVDLAAMRDAVARMGGDPKKINPLCPVDLVIDHSVQVDVSGVADAWKQNEQIEFNRNYERFEFLKWGSTAFNNFSIIPPGSGIVHQVNLQYLARVVLENARGIVYPDSVVGTDSHTTMINGLGIVGWGVGGIEAEAVMLGQPISMVLPEVIGFRLTGSLREHVTATDLVLQVTNMLRKRGVVGKFVEFFGPGCAKLSLADRATIGNMAPEYGATIGYFPQDAEAINYLRLTNRQPEKIALIEKTLKVQGLLKNYNANENIVFTDVLELDLATVEPCISGPKRPHDRVPLSQVKQDFTKCLPNKIGFKGFGVPEHKLKSEQKFTHKGKQYSLKNGSVVLAAITSCTNTSNPDAMVAAGLVAKKAVAKGLKPLPYIKTSLSPGSNAVTEYLNAAGLTPFLDQIGFTTAGYGCMTCIGNSGDLLPEVSESITASDCVAAAVLSGNRNFEARIHPLIKANYLASPPLVVAYALAGRMDIDFETEPLSQDQNGKPVFLKDIWPSRTEVKEVVSMSVTSEMFKKVYGNISKGSDRWNSLNVKPSERYSWKDSSTYIHNPPFFQTTQKQLPKRQSIQNAYCLAWFGDSITTDHISPAGNIAKNSPAARYLKSRGVEQKDFNTYGARRGNDEVMARGTFANTRIINKLAPKIGPQTTYIPTGELLDIYDAAEKYKQDGHQTIILAGAEDWAAKGPYLQGIKAVIAQSFERIHRSNLAGMGIVPLQFLPGQNAESLQLKGNEKFTIALPEEIKVNEMISVRTDSGKEFKVKLRLDTDVEIEYYKNGGILHYVLRKLISA